MIGEVETESKSKSERASERASDAVVVRDWECSNRSLKGGGRQAEHAQRRWRRERVARCTLLRNALSHNFGVAHQTGKQILVTFGAQHCRIAAAAQRGARA
jgi:hypothetical protein